MFLLVCWLRIFLAADSAYFLAKKKMGDRRLPKENEKKCALCGRNTSSSFVYCPPPEDQRKFVIKYRGQKSKDANGHPLICIEHKEEFSSTSSSEEDENKDDFTKLLQQESNLRVRDLINTLLEELGDKVKPTILQWLKK